MGRIDRSSADASENREASLAKRRAVGQEQIMIAKLTGRLDEAGAAWVVLDVGGVGYLVHCSAKTLAA